MASLPLMGALRGTEEKPSEVTRPCSLGTWRPSCSGAGCWQQPPPAWGSIPLLPGSGAPCRTGWASRLVREFRSASLKSSVSVAGRPVRAELRSPVNRLCLKVKSTSERLWARSHKRLV